MRVSADYEIAWAHNPLLGKQRMLYSHAAHLPVVANMMGVSEVTNDLCLPRAFDVLVRSIVIRDKAYAIRVENLCRAELSKGLNGDRRCDVICQYHVEVAFDELSRSNLRQLRMGGQDFFCNSHWPAHARPPSENGLWISFD